MKVSFSLLAVAVGLLVIVPAGNAWAEQNDTSGAETTTAQAADPTKQIPHTLQALEEAKAGKYGKLKRDDRQRLEAADRDIQALMQRNPDLGTLNDAERVQLFNAQETIIATVNGLKRSQLVCTYQQQPGTRFKTKHCMTRDMADATKRGARDSLHAAQNPMCVPGEGQDCMTGMQRDLRQGEYQPPGYGGSGRP